MKNAKTSKTMSRKRKSTSAPAAVRKYVDKRLKQSVEIKYKDTKLSNLTAQVTPLNAISQGTDYNQRIGRHLKLQSLVIKAVPTTNHKQETYARYWIVLDKQSGGQSPSVTEMFEDATPDLTVNSLRNISKWGDRFKILKTDLIKIPSKVTPDLAALAQKTADPDGVTLLAAIDVYINLNNIDTEFYSGDSTTISSGGLYIVSTLGNSDGTEGRFMFNGYARLAYTDA